MKVVISTYTFLPEIGGVSTCEAILAEAFVDAGYDVSVVTLTPGDTTGFRFPVYRNPSCATLFRLYRQADILILANLSLKLAYPLLILSKRFALRHHSESAFTLSTSPFSADLLRRRLLSKSVHFMTSAYVGQKSGFENFEVTHPFASTDQISREIMLPLSQRSGLLFVGRLEPEKGVDWLLKNWPLARQHLGVKELRILGPGSMYDGIRQRIDDGELPGVTVLGPLTRADTAREMGRAKYIIVPSLWQEPFGAVALEGLAAGAIPIVSDRGGLKEAVADNGCCYNPDDECSFIDALQQAQMLYTTQSDFEASRSAWLKQVEAHLYKFEPEHVVQKIVSLMTDRESIPKLV